MDKERVFYANTLLFSSSETEAVFIFGVRPIGKGGPVKEANEQEDDGQERDESVEVARIYIPHALAGLIIKDMARRYAEEQAEEEPAIAKSTE